MAGTEETLIMLVVPPELSVETVVLAVAAAGRVNVALMRFIAVSGAAGVPAVFVTMRVPPFRLMVLVPVPTERVPTASVPLVTFSEPVEEPPVPRRMAITTLLTDRLPVPVILMVPVAI